MERSALDVAGGLTGSGNRLGATIAELLNLTAEEPLRELRWELLIHAQALQGRNVEALRSFQQARRELAELPGLAMPDALCALELAILNHTDLPPLPQPGSAPRVRKSPVVGSSTSDSRRSRFPAVHQLEFRGYRKQLDLLAMACSGNPSPLHETDAQAEAASGLQVVGVSGAPGAGKSRLLETFVSNCSGGGREIHRGTCAVDQGRAPFQPVVDIVRSLIAAERPTPQELSALSVLVPELSGTGQHEAGTTSGDERQLVLFETIKSLLGRAARRGAIIVLDDAQWADPATAEVLTYCWSALAAENSTAVIAHRAGERPGWFPTEPTCRTLVEVELDGIDLQSSGLLVREILGYADDGLVRELRELTGGSPLYLRELAQALREHQTSLSELLEGLPANLSSLLSQRTSVVGDIEQRILGILAVVSGVVNTELLGEALKLDEWQIDESLRSLATAGIIVVRPSPDGDVLAFAHELFRVAVLESLSEADLPSIHETIAQAAGELARHDPARWVGVQAHHWYEAGPGGNPSAAEETNAAAGALAFEQTAFQAAGAAYVRATDALGWQGRQTEAGQLFLQAAEAAHRSGDTESRRDCAQRAAKLALDASDFQTLARAALIHGGARSTYGMENPDTTELLRTAATALANVSGAEPLQAMVTARLAQEINHMGELDMSREMTAHAVALASRTDDERAKAAVFRDRIWTLNHPDFIKDREVAIADMLEHTLAVGDPELEMEARVWRAALRLEQGETVLFDTEIAELDSLAAIRPIPSLLVRIATLKATSASLRGLFDVALVRSQLAWEAAQRIEPENGDQVLQAQMISPLREQSLLGTVLPMITMMAEEYRDAPGWRCALSFVLSEAGEIEAAAEEVAELHELGFGNVRRDLAWAMGMSFIAEAIATVGDVQAAQDLLPLVEPYTGTFVSLWDIASHGSMDYFLGRLAMTVGDGERASRYFDSAVRCNQQSMHFPQAMRSEIYQTVISVELGTLDAAEGSTRLAAVSAAAREKGWNSIAEKANQIELNLSISAS